MKSLFFISIAIVIILNASCKRYPDGPVFSIYSKENRVVGVWDVAYYGVNGDDSTDVLKNNPRYGKFSFGSKTHENRASYTGVSSSISASGSWEFTNNKNNLYITLTYNTNTINGIGPYGANVMTWGIRRLTKTEMWLKRSEGTKEYIVKFKK